MIVSSLNYTHSAGAYIDPANEPGKTSSITSLASDSTKTLTVNTAKKRRSYAHRYIVATLGALAVVGGLVFTLNRKQSPQDVSPQDLQTPKPIAPLTSPSPGALTPHDPFADVYHQAYKTMRPFFDEALENSLPKTDTEWRAYMFFLCFDRTNGVIEKRSEFIKLLNAFKGGAGASAHMIFYNFLYKACDSKLQPKKEEKQCQLKTEFDIIKNFPSILSGTAGPELLNSISSVSKEILQNAEITKPEYATEIAKISYNDVLNCHKTFQTLKEKFESFSKFWLLRYGFQLARKNSLEWIIPLLENEHKHEFPVLLEQLQKLDQDIQKPQLSAAERYALHKQIHTTLKDDIGKLVPKLHRSWETYIGIFVRTLEPVLECDPSFMAASKIDLDSVFKNFKQD